jgi:hypothetical protein
LTANPAGTTPLGGAVGGTTALSSLTTDAAGNVALNGGAVTTTGAQSYNDVTTLGADTTLTSTSAGNVTFGSTIDFTHALTANTAGTTTFGGAVGGNSPLSSLTTDAAGSTAINGGLVVTSGAQAYNDAATIGANTQLSAAGNITFGSALDGAFSLTAFTAATKTFGGAVGGGTALSSLTINGGGTTALNGGAVTTTGAQTYNDAATLGANTTLTSVGGGNVIFFSTLNGAHSLTANTAGTTAFGDTVGNGTALSSLTTDAAGSSAVNGGAVTTSGSQTFRDLVTIGNVNATLASSSGSVTAASTVSLGTQDLTIVGAGALQGAVDGSGELTKAGAGTLTLSATNTYTGLTTVSAGTLAVNGSLDTAGPGVLVSSTGTLGGTGTVGDVTSSGTVAPGNSVGTLQARSATLSGGSHYAVELDSGGADRIDATSNVDLGGANLDLTLLGSYVHTPGTVYTILTATSAVSGTFAGLLQGATVTAGGDSFTISYNSHTVTLTAKASPSLATNASAGGSLGASVHDTATLTDGFNPNGTITFHLYGSNDPNCSGTPAFTDTKSLSSGNGSYDSSDFTPTQAGVYRWTASYSGDSNNNAAASPCNDSGESVTVSAPPPVQPAVSKLHLVPDSFVASKKPTPLGAPTRKGATGTTIRFTLTSNALVHFWIRHVPRRRPSPSAPKFPYAFNRRLGAGAHSVPFTGTLHHTLLPGNYMLYARAIDTASGYRSPQVSAKFTILRG